MDQKITEITETRYRTSYEKDAKGNRVRKSIPFKAYRDVKVVQGGKRFAHFFVDMIVFEIIYQFLSFLLTFIVLPDADVSFQIAIGIFSVGVFFTFMYPVYYFFFEFVFQKTPGKFLTKCRVIDVYGNKPPFGTMLLRSLIRMVPFEAFSCMSERGWHDRWSETFVVPDEEYKKLMELLGRDEFSEIK